MISYLLGILFPIRCLGCQRYDAWLCPECLPSLPGVYQHPLLKHAIHLMKYQGYRGIAVDLGQQLVKAVPEDTYDVIVPVPLHWQRRWLRGYNQTELLAEQFCKPVLPALRKVKPTPAQATLNRAQRQRNLHGAFAINQRYQAYIHNKRVLLIDDVYSTGSTTATCSDILLKAGARSITVVVVAVNQLNNSVLSSILDMSLKFNKNESNGKA